MLDDGSLSEPAVYLGTASDFDLVINQLNTHYITSRSNNDSTFNNIYVNDQTLVKTGDSIQYAENPTVAINSNDDATTIWEAQPTFLANERLFIAEQGRHTTKHYYVNGQRLATRVDNALYYLHSDHLGSTTLVTDNSGTEMGRAEFDPYGNVIANTIPLDLTDRLFTGQRFDPNTGLYDYRARFYDPLTGSFVQPDSIVPDSMDPRAWNRFSYVYGNPVNYTDPSGHIPVPLLVAAGVGLFAVGGYGGHLAATSAGYEVGSPQWYGSVGLSGSVTLASGGLAYLGTPALVVLGFAIAGDTAVEAGILERPFGLSLASSVAQNLVPDIIGYGVGRFLRRWSFQEFLINQGIGNSKEAKRVSQKYFRDVKKQIGLIPGNQPKRVSMLGSRPFVETMEAHHRFIPYRQNWVPNFIRHSKYNLKKVWTLEHARIDPYRYRTLPRWVKDYIEKNGWPY